MIILYDANVLISYLLTSEKEGAIASIVEAGFEGKYTFYLPAEVIVELQKKITVKEFLHQRIPKPTAEKFITALTTIAIVPKPITEQIPKVGRDLKDDYLLAYAVVGKADYLVSGDEDLLVIRHIENTTIVSPSQFLKVLNK